MIRDYRFTHINGMLKGQDVYLVGSGPSLKDFPFYKLGGKYAIAINHTIEFFPDAWALLFGDKVFLAHTCFDVSKYSGLIFCSERCMTSRPIEQMIPADNVYIYRDRRDEPYTNSKLGLYHTTSSGIQALNLAIQMQAGKIYLLGYDYCFPHGERHFYGDIYAHHAKYPEDRVWAKVEKLERFKKWRDRIVNLSTISTIPYFEKRDWREVFA